MKRVRAKETPDQRQQRLVKQKEASKLNRLSKNPSTILQDDQIPATSNNMQHATYIVPQTPAERKKRARANETTEQQEQKLHKQKELSRRRRLSIKNDTSLQDDQIPTTSDSMQPTTSFAL